MNRSNKLAFAIFGNFVRKNKESYFSVRSSIKQGHIAMPWDIYVSSAYLYSIITGFIGVVFGLLLSPLWGILYSNYIKALTVSDFKGYGGLLFTALIILFICVFLAMISYYLLLAYPGLVAKVRKSKIDLTLPHGVAYMHAMSKGGLSLISIFKSLSQHTDIYGEFAEEIDYIVLDTANTWQ